MLSEGGEDDFDAILAEMEKEISMADVMSELGYGCTVNVSQCKDTLSLFLPLSDATVAKILGTIARTYAGLDDSQNVFATFRSALGGSSVLDLPSLNSWNVDVLVDSIKQLVGSMVLLSCSFCNVFPIRELNVFIQLLLLRLFCFRFRKSTGLTSWRSWIMRVFISLMRQHFPFLCLFIDMHARYTLILELIFFHSC